MKYIGLPFPSYGCNYNEITPKRTVTLSCLNNISILSVMLKIFKY